MAPSALEQHLADDPRRARRWLELAEVRLNDGREAEAVDAWERGIWALTPPQDRQAREALVWALGDLDAPDSDAAARLWRQAAAARSWAEEPDGERALAIVRNRVLNDDALPLRTRWLVAQLLCEAAPAAVFAEALRVRLEGQLRLASPPAPAFVSEAVEARRPSPRLVQARLGELEERAEAEQDPAQRALGLLEVARGYAQNGDKLPALQVVEAAQPLWETLPAGQWSAKVEAQVLSGLVRQQVSGQDAGASDFDEALDRLENRAAGLRSPLLKFVREQVEAAAHHGLAIEAYRERLAQLARGAAAAELPAPTAIHQAVARVLAEADPWDGPEGWRTRERALLGQRLERELNSAAAPAGRPASSA